MKFWTLFQNKFVFNRTYVSIVVIARCLSGLSWLFSPQVWKSMELLLLISSTATRGCSIGGMYYLCVPLPVFYTYQCVPVTWSRHVTHNNCTKVPLCRTLTLPKIYLLTTFTVPITNLYYPVQVLPPALHTGLWVLHQGLVCNLRRSLLRIYSRQLTGRIQGVPR